MKIELKKITVHQRLSEETRCFSADVYIDGKKAGEATNRGHGGCNDYHPFALQQRLNEHAKTLPKRTVELGNGPFTFQPDADTIVDELVDEWAAAKDLRKLTADRLVWVAADGKLYSTKKIPRDKISKVAADPAVHAKLKIEPQRLLNLLPFEKALPLFIAAAD